MPNKKPVTPAEIQEDIQNHPERGQINGEDIVRFDGVNLQFSIPKEMYRQLLEIGAALGLSKNDIFRLAFSQFVSSSGNQAMVERWQKQKAEKYTVNTVQIRSKIFGSYKNVARERRSRLKSD